VEGKVAWNVLRASSAGALAPPRRAGEILTGGSGVVRRAFSGSRPYGRHVRGRGVSNLTWVAGNGRRAGLSDRVYSSALDMIHPIGKENGGLDWSWGVGAAPAAEILSA
jgi:hypothetical protein